MCAAADAFAEYGEGRVGGFSVGSFSVTNYRDGGTTGSEVARGGRARGARGDGPLLLGGAPMRYLRPIPRRLLPDDMLVFLPAEGGGRGESRLVRAREVRARGGGSSPTRTARPTLGTGRCSWTRVNSEGALEVPAGGRVLIGAGPSMLVRSCRRCCVVRGQVHHWELEVG